MTNEELQVLLAKIEFNQQAIIEKLEESKEHRVDLERRISSIESKLNMAAGAITVITASITFALSYVIDKLKGAS